MLTVPRLLDKQLIKVVAEDEEKGYPAYTWTEIGYAVAQKLKGGLRKVKMTPQVSAAKSDDTAAQDGASEFPALLGRGSTGSPSVAIRGQLLGLDFLDPPSAALALPGMPTCKSPWSATT